MRKFRRTVIVIPDEIIIDILSRLPVKSLTRFGTLSKWWSNFLKSSEFVGDHLRRSAEKDPSLLLFCTLPGNHYLFYRLQTDISDELQQVDIPISQNWDSFFEISGCCNGLVCVFSCSHTPSDPESESFKLCLWNPATKQIRQLPYTRNESETIRTIGFGYDSNTNDYKVVIINYFDDDDDAFYDNFRVFQAEMYSLSTGCWKKIKSDVDFQDMFMEDSSVTVNGMLFWRVEEEEYQFVLSFDMGKEEFRIIVMPDSIEYCYRIAKFKDSLVLLSEYYEDAGLGWAVSVDLWVMEHNCDGGQSWSKLFTVGTFYKINCPVGIWKNEIFIQGCKNTEEESGMLLCNPTNNEMKILTDIGSAHLYDVFNYVESLVPV